MGRKKMIVMDDPVLTDEQKEQCHKNALIWETVHRDLISRIGIPFFECGSENNQYTSKLTFKNRSILEISKIMY